MEQFYLVCALFGGTIFICQFLLGLLGLGDHHDFSGDVDGVDHDFGGGIHDGGAAEHPGGDHEFGHGSAMSWFVGVISLRTIVAGLTFFGLAGMAAQSHGAHPAGTLAVAVACGAGAFYAVAWIMKTFYRLKADGTVRVENTIGQAGIVYLTIPARRSGKGKVTVTVQNRTMEYEAETEQSEIPTGTTVRIVAIVDSETLVAETVSGTISATTVS